MHKYKVTQKIQLEKIKSFHLDVVANDVSAKQMLVINGIKISGGAGASGGNGILGFELSMPADKKPVIIITYHKHMITKKVAESLGLERIDYDTPPRTVIREEV